MVSPFPPSTPENALNKEKQETRKQQSLLEDEEARSSGFQRTLPLLGDPAVSLSLVSLCLKHWKKGPQTRKNKTNQKKKLGPHQEGPQTRNKKTRKRKTCFVLVSVFFHVFWFGALLLEAPGILFSSCFFSCCLGIFLRTLVYLMCYLVVSVFIFYLFTSANWEDGHPLQAFVLTAVFQYIIQASLK